jgi:sugar O-acyltransferase (sialic acid O-acetyltransferase NeuD family)
MAQRLVVVGAGGHAKVVIAAIEACGDEVVAVLDDDRATWGTSILGHQVHGPVAIDLIPDGSSVVLAIGANAARKAKADALRVRFGTVVDPRAIIHSSVTIGEGVVVFAGAVIQPDANIGPHAIINTSASIDHDARIGAFAHIAPGVHMSGNVTVGEGALIGVGAALIPGVTIGDWATVGAGAAVIRNVPRGATAVGCPAKPVVKQ